MGKLYLFNVYTFCKYLYVVNVVSWYGLPWGPYIYFIFIWSNVVGWGVILLIYSHSYIITNDSAYYIMFRIKRWGKRFYIYIFFLKTFFLYVTQIFFEVQIYTSLCKFVQVYTSLFPQDMMHDNIYVYIYFTL